MPEEVPQELPISIENIEVPKLRKGVSLFERNAIKTKKSSLRFEHEDEISDEEIDSDDESGIRFDKLRDLVFSQRNSTFGKSLDPSAFLEHLKEQRLLARSSSSSNSTREGPPDYLLEQIPMFRHVPRIMAEESDEEDLSVDSVVPFDQFIIQRRFSDRHLDEEEDEEDDDDEDNDDMEDDDDDDERIELTYF